MNQKMTPAADPIVQKPPSASKRRPLSAWEWLVSVPLGFLWLGILLVLAIPACLYMTVLYFVVSAARALSGKRPDDRNQ